MSVVVFSPFGLMKEESGILGLLSSYLAKNAWQISFLRCNGVFSLCDRDGEHNWKRDSGSCFACMHEQSRCAKWSGIANRDLSPFLLQGDVLESKRWMASLDIEQCYSAQFQGVAVYELCKGSLHYRYGTVEPDLRNKSVEQFVRRTMVSAVRMLLASQRYFQQVRHELVLVGGGSDYMTGAFLLAARKEGVRTAVFKWDLSKRSVVVRHPSQEREYQCPLVFEDVTAMRPDCQTWPGEILQILEELGAFLELTGSQLELPIVP